MIEGYERKTKVIVGNKADAQKFDLPSSVDSIDGYNELSNYILVLGLSSLDALIKWHYLFPDKKIIACSSIPFSLPTIYNIQNIRVIFGNACSDVVAHKILSCYDRFDCIIDSTPHDSDEIIKHFIKYFTCLNNSGKYLIEDLNGYLLSIFEAGHFSSQSPIAFIKCLADISRNKSACKVSYKDDALDFFQKSTHCN